MPELDFSNASADDFNLGPVEIAEGSNDVGSAIEQQPASSTEPAVSQTVPTENYSKEITSNDSYQPEINDSQTDRGVRFKDDFIKGVVEYYEKTGDLTPYLQAKTIDFNRMSDEEIMRLNLRDQYSNLSDKAFDRLYKQQVIERYKLDADEYGEEDYELGKELLSSEASKIRESYIDWQKNFAPPEVQNEYPDQNEEILRRFEQEVRSSEFTKNVLNGKRISIKTQDGDFNYEIPNANDMVEMTIDNDRFFSQFAGEGGNLDYAKWYKTVAYSQNPEMFERALINYGRTLGRSEVTKEIKNPSNVQVGDVPTEDSGDFVTGLLNAFANRAIKK